MVMVQRVDLEELDPVAVELEAISLFGAINSEQLLQLWTYLEERHLAFGDVVFRQGDLPSAIYVLMSGEIELSRKTDMGESRVIGRCLPGDTFGESAYIGIQVQAGTARVASRTVECLALGRDALVAIQTRHVELFSLLMMNVAREISRKYHRQICLH